MKVDFRDAALRHLEDARTLDAAGRYANADHLYGIAAECMLKAVMAGLGAATSRRGDLRERAYRTHIDTLWNEFVAFASGEGGMAYLPFPPQHRPFQEWQAAQRYAPRRDFSAARMERLHRREEAAAIAGSLQAALLDGIL